MKEQDLLNLATAEGFLAALIDPKDIPVDRKFRLYCEQNLCGQYGANYACPPDCGTPEALHTRLLAEQQVLVITTTWEIEDYSDKTAMIHAKTAHNAAVLRLRQKMKDAGYPGFCAGYNGCPLCDVCNCKTGLPCAHPEERIDCLSSYCVDVAALAKRCDLDFAWTPNKLHLFGIIAFHAAETSQIVRDPSEHFHSK